MFQLHQFPKFDLCIEKRDCFQTSDFSSSGDEIIRNFVVDLNHQHQQTRVSTKTLKMRGTKSLPLITLRSQNSSRYAMELFKSIFSNFYTSDLFLLISFI